MEPNPREVELNFGNGSEEQIEELENIQSELSAVVEEDDSFQVDDAQADYCDDYVSESNNVDGFAGEEPGNDQSMDNSAAGDKSMTPPVMKVHPESEMLLKSRQPMNRPAGTPPLDMNMGVEQISALEMAVAGKSYGTALRILREQNNMSYAELEQLTHIQPRFIEALENETLRESMSLAFVIGYIRTLCRVYGVSRDTSDALVAKLKEQLEYSCNDEFINSLDVDSSGAAANERRLKQIMWSCCAIGAAVLALIVLIVVMVNSCSSDNTSSVENTGTEQLENAGTESFDPNSIKPLLKEPELELQRLPLAE